MRFSKDGKTYFFSSKFKSLNNLYNISKDDKKNVDDKLTRQINFLKNRCLTYHDERLSKTLFDLSYGANIRPDVYLAEMSNRVNTMMQYAEQNKFDDPFFITITPKSEYKPLKQIKLGKSNYYKLIDNPKFNGNPDYVKEARDYLSYTWTKFLNNRVFNKQILPKYGIKSIYAKTYEPQLDGTPHLHVLLFVPKGYKDRILKACSESFKHSRFDVKTDFYEDKQAVLSYIMKYILKSFSNSKTGELDTVGYWYAKNRIMRFTTSRTLLPLKFYRLIKHGDNKDYLDLTNRYKIGLIEPQIMLKNTYMDKPYNELKMSDYKLHSIIYKEVIDDYLTETMIYRRKQGFDFHIIFPVPKLKFSLVKKKRPIPLYHDTSKIGYIFDGIAYYFKDSINIKAKSDIFLYEYYNNLDIDTCDLNHFGYVKNELISRGLIQGEILSLNDYKNASNW